MKLLWLLRLLYVKAKNRPEEGSKKCLSHSEIFKYAFCHFILKSDLHLSHCYVMWKVGQHFGKFWVAVNQAFLYRVWGVHLSLLCTFRVKTSYLFHRKINQYSKLHSIFRSRVGNKILLNPSLMPQIQYDSLDDADRWNNQQSKSCSKSHRKCFSSITYSWICYLAKSWGHNSTTFSLFLSSPTQCWHEA